MHANAWLCFIDVIAGKIVPAEKIHARLWEGANKKFHAIPWGKLEREKHNKACLWIG
jgi:hypothetical protein